MARNGILFSTIFSRATANDRIITHLIRLLLSLESKDQTPGYGCCTRYSLCIKLHVYPAAIHTLELKTIPSKSHVRKELFLKHNDLPKGII